MRNSARGARNYKELYILATNMDEIFLPGIISTNKKKKEKKKYHILMKILERRTHEISSKIHQFVKDLD